MTTFQGKRGYLALGGNVRSTNVLETAALHGSGLAALTARVRAGGTGYGVIADGDRFQIPAETGSPVHTIVYSGSPLVLNGDTNLSVLGFVPPLASAVPAGSQINLLSNAIAQIRSWSLNATAPMLDSTVMGQDWKSFVPAIQDWKGSASALLDRNDSRQAILLDLIATRQTASLPSLAMLSLGLEATSGTTPGFSHFYGAAETSDWAEKSAVGTLTEVTFSFTGAGPLVRQFT
jgi:hypothetical protein